MIYYVVLLQCSWPHLEYSNQFINSFQQNQPLKVMLLADIHLLGSRKGHWFDKLRREWQMYRAFQTVMTVHNPNAVFVLGDLFDEGLWCSKKEFNYYIQRFHSLFNVPQETKLFVVPGNHDMGFHYWMDDYLKQRFDAAFNISSVDLITLRGNSFVLLNSMAMEGDGCHFCKSADKQLQKIANILNSNKNEKTSQRYTNVEKLQNSKPIFLQHFPMYRSSDKNCNEPDSAPPEAKFQIFREKWECLSKEASDKVLKLLNPRVIFTGHTHYGCHVIHNEDIHEWTIPSFSWRNINNPSFILFIYDYNDSEDELDRPFKQLVPSRKKFSFLSFRSENIFEKRTIFMENDPGRIDKNIKYLLNAQIYVLYLDRRQNDSLDVRLDRNRKLRTKNFNRVQETSISYKSESVAPNKNQIFIPSALKMNDMNYNDSGALSRSIKYYSSDTDLEDGRRISRKQDYYSESEESDQENWNSYGDKGNYKTVVMRKTKRLPNTSRDVTIPVETINVNDRSTRKGIPTYVEATINKKRISCHQNTPREVKEASRNVFIQAKLKPRKELKKDHPPFYER
ncbi:metallophosphoesterase 1-like isoform X2 [Centruroides sculpturatus]|nr:metallophosphoesterase 1-like isoform X2 [Centruroides sculpturatus]